jgi:hypothetical protein
MRVIVTPVPIARSTAAASLVASTAHAVVNASSPVPGLGASGALPVFWRSPTPMRSFASSCRSSFSQSFFWVDPSRARDEPLVAWVTHDREHIVPSMVGSHEIEQKHALSTPREAQRFERRSNAQMKPVLIPALDLWASWQREAVLNITRAALMPMAAFASMARSATSARGQRTESSEGRPQAWQGGERVTSISGFRSGEQDRSSSGEAAPRSAQDAEANLMRKALEEGCEALHEAAASFIAASKSVSEEFSRSADRHIAAINEAGEALLKLASESSERFAVIARQAAEGLREAVIGLSEASKELSRVAREAGEALKKDAKSAADEIPQAGKNSDKAAARGGDGSRKKKSAKAAGPSRESNGHRRKSARSSERRAH